MNCIQKMLAAALGCVLSALLLTGCGEKEEPVNITLANHSGHGITSISITPSTSDEWDTELVDGIFQSGEMMEVSLGSYKPSELPDFNILVYNEESYVLYDNDVDEVDFTIHDGDYVVFLSPDGDDSIVVCTSEEYDNLYAGDGENAPTGYTAEELGQTGGMSGFSGCWKLENAPFYFVINDNYPHDQYRSCDGACGVSHRIYTEHHSGNRFHSRCFFGGMAWGAPTERRTAGIRGYCAAVHRHHDDEGGMDRGIGP